MAHFLNPPGLSAFDAAGVKQPGAMGMQAVAVAGPASYAANGIPVDVSALFSKILAVMPCGQRAATGLMPAAPITVLNPVQTGTDTYANGKFRLALGQALYTPAGTVAAPVFTGNAVASGAPSATVAVGSSVHTHTTGAPSATVAVGSSAHTHTPTQRSSTCVATCNCASGAGLTGTASMNPTAGPSATTTVGDGTHTHTTGAPSATTTVGDSAHTHTTTATGTNSAPAFTGTQASIQPVELAALSAAANGITFDVLVFGILR